jgi:hypothetical protein
MTLCILNNATLEEMEKWVEDLFNQVENKNV